MSSVSKTILIGRVGNEPETRRLESGKTVTNFSLATFETYKDQRGEKKEETEWHRISIWGKLAEIVEKYVKKGDLIYLEGKNKTRSWEKDGVTRYTTEVVCNQMTMLGGKVEKTTEKPTQEASEWEGEAESGDTSDSLPF